MPYWLYLSVFLVLAHWAFLPFIEVVVRQCVRSRPEEKAGMLFGFSAFILAVGLVIHLLSMTGNEIGFHNGYEFGYKAGWAAYVATWVQLLVARRVREAETEYVEEKEGLTEKEVREMQEEWKRKWNEFTAAHREVKREVRYLRHELPRHRIK